MTQSRALPLRAVAEAVPGLLWVTSSEGSNSFVNRGFCEFSGRSPEALLGYGWRDLVHPDDFDRAAPLWQSAVAERKPFQFEYRFRRHDGVWRWHLVRAVPHLGEDDSIQAWIGTATDITERREVEVALARANRSLEVALDGARAARWEINLATGAVEWSPQSYRQLGFEVGAVPSTLDMFRAHTHPGDLEALDRVRVSELTAAPGTRFAVALRIIKADGEVCWIDRRSIVGPDEPDGRRVFGVDFDITARKRVEEQLSASEQRLREAADLVQLSTFEWQPATDSLAYDDRLRAMWGMPAGAAADAEQFRARVLAEDRPVLNQALERALDPAGSGEYAAVFRVEGLDGKLRWVSTRGRVSFTDGRPSSLIGAALDVTQTKEREDALRIALANLDAVYDSAPVGLCVIRADGTYERINARLAQINGLPVEAHLGRHVREIVPGLASLVEPTFVKVVASGQPAFDVEIEGETGAAVGVRRSWLMHMSPLFDPSGRVSAVNVVAEETTEKKRAAAALEREQLFTRGVIEASPAIIYVYDLNDDRALFVSSRAAQVLGYTPGEFEELGPRGFARLIHPEDEQQFHNRLQDVRTGERDRVYEAEYRMRRNDGGWAWFLSRARVVSWENGKPSRLIGIATEITERKAAEARQAVLLAELSHRVKNTLAVVQSVARQTFVGVPEAQAAREEFEARLMAMAAAHDILTAENWEGAPLRALVEGALAPLTAITPGRLEISGPAVIVTPRFAVALAMALHELGTNAVKYGALSTAEGRVQVSWVVAGDGDGPRLEFAWRESGGPPVEPPAHRGFGSVLIEINLASELDSKVDMAFEPAGVVCRVSVPLTRRGSH